MEPGTIIRTHAHTYGNVVTLGLEGSLRVQNFEMYGEEAAEWLSATLDGIDRVDYWVSPTNRVYDAIRAHAYVSDGATDPYTLSGWAQQAIAVVSSEKARLRELDEADRRSKRDSQIGMRARRG